MVAGEEDPSFASSGTVALAVATLFFSLVAIRVLPHFSFLFLSPHGWSHRVAGFIHFAWLLVGAASCWMSVRSGGENESENASENTSLSVWSLMASLVGSKDFVLVYDVLLGCSGVLTTLTAARDFPHKRVTNVPGRSGTLHRTAIVTQSEMIEHSFYQFLNLSQAVYLHALHRINYADGNGIGNGNGNGIGNGIGAGGDDHGRPWWLRIGCLWAVTAPWLVRHRFPVHSFSQNWLSSGTSTQQGFGARFGTIRARNGNGNGNDERGEVLLYRIKKAQYLFYKHVILHGLNISMALGDDNDNDERTSVPHGTEWRVFWLLLNTSYAMEFFLQTLVKRGVLSQPAMMVLQKLLMAAASLSAASVLATSVRPGVCLASFALNLAHRHHDVTNTLGIAVGALLWVRVLG